jgi:transcriptional regulator with XRE-family HTH domain
MHDEKYAAVYAEEAAVVDASELIAEALDQSGITRAELARRLNVNRSEVTSLLEGERNISVKKLARTLHRLGFRLSLGSSKLVAEQDSTVEFHRFLASQRTGESSLPVGDESDRKFVERGLVVDA